MPLVPAAGTLIAGAAFRGASRVGARGAAGLGALGAVAGRAYFVPIADDPEKRADDLEDGDESVGDG